VKNAKYLVRRAFFGQEGALSWCKGYFGATEPGCNFVSSYFDYDFEVLHSVVRPALSLIHDY